jgi:hypothetical protein
MHLDAPHYKGHGQLDNFTYTLILQIQQVIIPYTPNCYHPEKANTTIQR